MGTPPPFLANPGRIQFNENKKNGSVSFFVSLTSIDLQKTKKFCHTVSE